MSRCQSQASDSGCLPSARTSREAAEIPCLTPEGYATHQLRHLGQPTVPLGVLSMKYLVHGAVESITINKASEELVQLQSPWQMRGIINKAIWENHSF